MQYGTGIFVWTTLIVINIVFIASSFWLLLYWQVKNTQLGVQLHQPLLPASVTQLATVTGIYNGYSTAYQVQLLAYGFYIMIIMATLIFLISLAMIKRVKVAIAVIEESSTAILKMPSIGTEF